jgi:hypothetical protein
MGYRAVNFSLNDELPWIHFCHNTVWREHEVDAESHHLETLEVVEAPRLCIRNAPCNAFLLESG